MSDLVQFFYRILRRENKNILFHGIKFFIILLFILPSHFSFAQDQQQDIQFETVVKKQIIDSLQRDVVKVYRFDKYYKVIEANRDYLLEESTQKLLQEFVNSKEFYDLAISSIFAKPVVFYGLIGLVIFSGAKIIIFSEVLQSFLPDFMIGPNLLISSGLTALGIKFILEELANYLIRSELPLPQSEKISRILRVKDKCQKLWSKKTTSKPD